MLRQSKSKFTILMSGFIMLTLFLLLNTSMVVQASHSMSVTEAQTCLNGATFDGSPSTSSALSIEMTGGVYDFDGFVVAHGDSHTFFEVGEVYRFTVPYPENTFTVGESITVSVSDSLTSSFGGEGAALTVIVQDCEIEDGSGGNDLNIPNDSLNIDEVFDSTTRAEFGSVFICADARLNCQPWALATVYCEAGNVIVYDTVTGTSGLPLIIVNEATIEAFGTPDQDTLLDSADTATNTVTLTLLENGELELVTRDFFTSKSYTFVWSGCHGAS